MEIRDQMADRNFGTFNAGRYSNPKLDVLIDATPPAKPATATPAGDGKAADGVMVVVLSDTTAGGETAQDAEVYTLRDGKTVRAQLYGDTAMMERVYGKKQVAAG